MARPKVITSCANTSAEQVRFARQIMEVEGLGVATPAEARATLDLKGSHRSTFW